MKREADQQSNYFVSNFKDIGLYLKNHGKCGKVLRLKWMVNHFMTVIYFAFFASFRQEMLVAFNRRLCVTEEVSHYKKYPVNMYYLF